MILTNTDLLDFLDKNIDKGLSPIKAISIKKNRVLVEQGKTCKYIYVLKEGIVKCSIMEDNSKSYTLEFLGIGEIMGEIEILLKCRNIATIKTLTDCLVYEIDIKYFRTVLLKDSNFSGLLMIELARRLLKTATRASSQQLNPLQVSLNNLLFLLKGQNVVFKKSDLAEYLGITIRSLNRELNKIGLGGE